MFTEMLMGKNGGDDPPPLTPQQRREWNDYVSFLEKKGYKGSPLLDKRDTGLATSLFNQFKKENPSVSLSIDHIKSVQSEMENLANAARNFEARRGNPNAPQIMAGTSKVDGWPGSKTTSFKFPDMEKKEYTNSVLTSQKNLGILNPQLKPTDSLSQRGLSSVTPSLPPNIKLEKQADGKMYYEDPKTGDWKLYNK
jgi:hypothetical protein